MAFSALGNIFVVTFSASRGMLSVHISIKIVPVPSKAQNTIQSLILILRVAVKQEIAKQGIFPTIAMSRFFSKEYESPINRLRNHIRRQNTVSTLQNEDKDGSLNTLEAGIIAAVPVPTPPELRGNMTPIPSIILHFFSSAILVMIMTYTTHPTDGAFFFFQLNGYIILVLVGMIMTSGLIYLHWFSTPSAIEYRRDGARWKPHGPFDGRIWAPIYLFGMMTLFVLNWLPPTEAPHEKTAIKWYIGPTVGSLIFFVVAPVYWVAMKFSMWWRKVELQVESHVFLGEDSEVVVEEKTVIFEYSATDRGGLRERGAGDGPKHSQNVFVRPFRGDYRG